MIEFLIKRTDGHWFEIPDSNFEDVVRPVSVPSRPLLGRDVYAIDTAGCEVTISFEEPGLQVSFMSGQVTEDLATKIVSEIAERITAATGQKSEVVQISR